MKTIKIILILLAAGLACSCLFEQEGPKMSASPKYHAIAESAPETRTAFERGDGIAKVVWNADDRISIFAKSTLNRQYRFTGENGAATGDFEEVSGASGEAEALAKSYAVYPYSADHAISTEGVVSLTWPSGQAYRESNYDPAAAVMFTCSADENLSFMHAGGYLCISLYGQGISVRSVTLAGADSQPLAGPAYVWAEGEAVKLRLLEGATGSITLTAASPVAIGASKESATEFWFCLPPAVFEHGFTVTVRDSGGRETVFSTARAISVERARMTRMEAVRIQMDGSVPTEPGVYYADGTTKVFDAVNFQLSCYRAGGQVWLRAVDLGNMRLTRLGPLPADVRAGLMSQVTFEEFAFMNPGNKTSRQVTVRVVSLGNDLITMVDQDNNYYVMRF
ncbi:MAG: hypothetical protein J6X77_03800 [Bacteroidales bacterium]|nr:hypothetical protein [Bacteroidales bacterium]